MSVRRTGLPDQRKQAEFQSQRPSDVTAPILSTEVKQHWDSQAHCEAMIQMHALHCTVTPMHCGVLRGRKSVCQALEVRYVVPQLIWH
jgi:hypothetical protein